MGFLPWYKVPNSEQLLLNLGTAIPDSALASSMTPQQTKSFLLGLLQDFMRWQIYKESLNIGMLMLPFGTLIVLMMGLSQYTIMQSLVLEGNLILTYLCLARQIQLDVSGNVIPEEERRYLWIPQILEKLNHVTNPLPTFFAKPNALQDVIRGIGHLCGDNIYSGIFLLGERAVGGIPGYN